MDNILAQPYYGDKIIRFYDTSNPVASSPLYTLDISNEINNNWGNDFGPNNIVVHNTKIFIAIANDDGNKGGVLVYNYTDIYPVRNANPPSVLKFNLADGLSSAGMAINPANGDLYVPTFHVSGNDGGVYVYTADSNYATMKIFADFSDNSVAEICANLAFDGKGNLWMTTWSPDNDPLHHFLICYKGIDKNDFYKITNTAAKSYTAGDVGGSSITVHLLSAPEGIAFDPSGNLWLANNNDFALTNNAGEGTLVKIKAGWIDTILAGAEHAPAVPAEQTDIKYIPAGKLGGLSFRENTIYINDQGQDQGSDFTINGTIWEWDINTAFNEGNFIPGGIHTTYPGNGGGSFIQPFLYVQDDIADDGTEPNTTTSQPWQSPDIWIRKAANGSIPGNDLSEAITGGKDGFVYVRIRNAGMSASRGTEILKLYWAKASAGLFWPAPWDGSINDPATAKPMGGLIVEQTLPSIPAGSTFIADPGGVAWTTPNPSDYTVKDGHFCLLARIESAAAYPFGMTFPEINNHIVKNVLNNNRAGWRNIHIVATAKKISIGGGIIAANYTDSVMNAGLNFELLNSDGDFMDLGTGKLLITAKGAALKKLNKTEYDHNAVEKVSDGVFNILDIKAGIENILLQPGEILNVKVAYLVEEKPLGAVLRVVQNEQDGDTKTITGGQTFVYRRERFPGATKKIGWHTPADYASTNSSNLFIMIRNQTSF